MENHPILVRLNTAERALAQARDLNEIKRIIDVSEAVRVWAKAAKNSEYCAHYAEELKLKSQRKAGEVLARLKKSKGGRNSAQAVRSSSEYRKGVEEVGIDRGSAQRWQQVAAVPEAKFHRYLDERRELTAEISTSGLLRQVNAEAKRERKFAVAAQIVAEPAPPPLGPFRVIVVDPPWKYDSHLDDSTHRGRCEYPDMTVEEIQQKVAVPKLAHEHCILWLWTTNAFMRQAFECIDAWRFEQKTILTWVKPHFGVGEWLRGQTEHCLLAIRGKPVVRLTKEATALFAPVREHSRKPQEFYDLVEALCPGSKLDVFGREKRDGWTVWGAETDLFQVAAAVAGC